MPAKDGERYVLVGSGPGSPRLQVESAVSPEALQRGLSGRPALPSGHAMLFIFPSLKRYSMWMPDMRFSIDLVWLDERLEIVHIQRGLQPCVPGGPCPSYGSERMALYAIEMPAGDVQRFGLRVGQSFRVAA